MATIKVGIDNKVGTVDPFQRIPTKLADFGGDTSGMDLLAKGVNSASDVMGAIALKQQIEDNERESKALELEFTTAINMISFGDGTDENRGFYDKKGENAIQSHKDAVTQVDELRRKIAAKASNPAVGRIFDAASAVHSETAKTSFAKHVVGERRVANDAASEARIASAASSAAQAYHDDDAVARSVAVARMEASTTAARNGEGEEAQARRIREAESLVLVSSIEAAVRENPARAAQLWARYRDRIDGRMHDGILTLLSEASFRDQSQQITDQIFNLKVDPETGELMTDERRLEMAREHSGKLRDEVVARVKTRNQEIEDAKTDKVKAASQNRAQVIDNMSISFGAKLALARKEKDPDIQDATVARLKTLQEERDADKKRMLPVDVQGVVDLVMTFDHMNMQEKEQWIRDNYDGEVEDSAITSMGSRIARRKAYEGMVQEEAEKTLYEKAWSGASLDELAKDTNSWAFALKSKSLMDDLRAITAITEKEKHWARTSDAATFYNISTMPTDQLATYNLWKDRGKMTEEEWGQALALQRAAEAHRQTQLGKKKTDPLRMETYRALETVLKDFAPAGIQWGKLDREEEMVKAQQAIMNNAWVEVEKFVKENDREPNASELQDIAAKVYRTVDSFSERSYINPKRWFGATHTPTAKIVGKYPDGRVPYDEVNPAFITEWSKTIGQAVTARGNQFDANKPEFKEFLGRAYWLIAAKDFETLNEELLDEFGFQIEIEGGIK